MKIRFLYHNPKGERGVGKAIVALTWFYALFYSWKVLKYNYSHVEIHLPDENGRFSDYDDSDRSYPPCRFFVGRCFSSTTRGKANGVRFAPAGVVLHHPGRWSYIGVEVDPERLEVALAESKKLVGKKYDYWALFGFIQPFAVQDPKKYFCSEICNWFGVLCGICKPDKRISPRRSAYKLAKVWGEPKKLC